MVMAIGGLHLENPCRSLLFYKRDFDVKHLHPSWVLDENSHLQLILQH